MAQKRYAPRPRPRPQPQKGPVCGSCVKALKDGLKRCPECGVRVVHNKESL